MPQRVSAAQLHWLAGLLEGEGCFAYGDSPGITLGMTDRDVVSKVAGLFDRTVRGPYKYGHNKRAVYYTSIFSGPAIQWMRRLLPLMGERRGEKIREHLERWAVAPGKGHKLGTGAVARCHKTRKHYAYGLCRACYRRDRYAKGLTR